MRARASGCARCGRDRRLCPFDRDSAAALKRAGRACRSINCRAAGRALRRRRSAPTVKLYPAINPAETIGFARRSASCEAADAFARGLDPRVRQVTLSLAGDWQDVEIIRGRRRDYRDTRPLIRFNVVVMSDNGDDARPWLARLRRPRRLSRLCRLRTRWQEAVARGRAPKPGGARGEAGAGRRNGCRPGRRAGPASCCMRRSAMGSKAISTARGPRLRGLMGQRIAAKGITVVDDGTIPDRRGSLTIDDEGTPSNCTTLIEDGMLVGYHAGPPQCPTHGREADRQRPAAILCPSPDAADDQYLHAGGRQAPRGNPPSVKRGLYAVSFGGGQVDITSGKFVFSCTEAYLIEDGRSRRRSRARPSSARGRCPHPHFDGRQ